jgi:endonuclease/exonuclease/phosphatase family metal-dependent hydrolase
VLAHYAAYDIPLPVPGRSALLAAALGLMASALVALRRPAAAVAPSGSLHGLVATGLVAALLIVPGSRLPSVEVGERATDVAALEVILANVHMGFDDRGRFTAPEMARLFAAEDADVVVLNEVDRGWLTTGSHDVGRVLEVGSGLRMVFAPAADDVWGNAILTHLPVSEVVVERLPRGRDAMWRSVLVVVLDLPDGDQVAVVATHLSHVDEQGDTRLPQAQAVAGIVARMRERGLPVVVAGDLNADADGAELAAFAGLVVDAGPIGVPTYPSSGPRVRIDHVLVSPEIAVVRRRVMDARLSDHRFVQVTLDLSAPPA